ncbi:MAG: response regulator [Alphaproteobacteria bacterium]|nr:response regulator [Alphaproteobacteria bacterium]
MQNDDPILIVDDSAAMRQTLKSTLIGMGHPNVHAASNGVEALEQCRERDFKLIFLDWNMPEMDGLEFLKTYRREPENKDSVVIMLTASGDKRSILTAIENGANYYITKPVSPDVIKKKMDQIKARLADQGEMS